MKKLKLNQNSNLEISIPQEEMDNNNREFTSLNDMVILATHHGLLVEVIWSFGNGRSEGMDTREATNYALTEWDI